jgi:hypothetical protein
MTYVDVRVPNWWAWAWLYANVTDIGVPFRRWAVANYETKARAT